MLSAQSTAYSLLLPGEGSAGVQPPPLLHVGQVLHPAVPGVAAHPLTAGQLPHYVGSTSHQDRVAVGDSAGVTAIMAW